ncbi:MAG TPA: ribosome assembly cofactor RimP [Bacteroidales bacterium]|nr:ribosome assembly cofactor RimP [Bacteroidales bacterium]
MIEKETIKGIVSEYLKSSDMFLVAVKVSSANRITVLADRKGGITLDECVSIHRFIESRLDRDIEDYELEVSSPGLDLPFLVKEQYYKNEGKKIEVTDTDGIKHTGILKNVTDGGFELETEVKVKGKSKEIKDISFNFDNIKSARVILIIK